MDHSTSWTTVRTQIACHENLSIWQEVYLEQSMRRYLHYYSIFRHQTEALMEPHRAHQVVDMVLSWTVQSQRRVPLRLMDTGAHPPGWTLPWLLDHLLTRWNFFQIYYYYYMIISIILKITSKCAFYILLNQIEINKGLYFPDFQVEIQ